MRAGGWNLIHTWLTDGILAKNWALIKELLELLLICPVDIERLKSNNCPKLIKGLSKEGSHQGVRMLASRLVEQWLKIVKGEAAPNSVPTQIMTVSVQSNTTPSNAIVLSSQQHYSVNAQQIVEATDAATIQVQDLKLAQQCTANALVNQSQQDQEKQQQPQERLQLQTVQLQVVGKAQQVQLQQQTAQQQCKKQSFVVVTSSSQSSIPVYKITIRDGNQVLAKVETDATNINNVFNTSGNTEVNENFVTDTTLSVKQEVKQKADIEEVGRSDSAISGKDYTIEIGQLNDSEHISSEVKQTVISSKDSQDAEGVKIKDNKDSRDIVTSDNSKSNDKENRDSHTKDEKKSGSSVDKKSNNYHHSSSSSSKSSKHSTSSSTHRSSSNSHKSSSHRSNSNSSSSTNSKSSSKDRSSKDKHHSSLSSKHSSSKTKSERDREREKEREKQKKDQAEKDKATLEKVQGQALSSKLGKIPKKRIEDEKLGDTSGRRPSTESKDGSKENKEKTDLKKDTLTTKIEKKNISISIENRKNTQDSMIRPKTVKTFNSKFRSTGLEEEVKLPPPRSKKSNTVVDKKVLPPKFPLKRSSPLRETIPLIEKRAKLSLDLPTTITVDEKKGGIKLIPPKPKRKYIGILLKIMAKTSLLNCEISRITFFLEHLYYILFLI
jgi:protein phosphatase 1 regulatory subunit 10